jgi:radical SAM superfamily enzyme YgiQ (UPF0313 family)
MVDRIVDLHMPTMPLGLGYIAAVLEATGHSVKVIDNCVERQNYRQLEESISRAAPEVVGISSDSFSFEDAVATAKAVKGLDKNITVVAGGPHANVWPDAPLHSPYFDISVYGEGERTAAELWEHLEGGEPIQEVKGIAYRKNGKIVTNPRRELVTDLDELPFPARHLFPFEKYCRRELSNHLDVEPVDTINTSRGCPFACRFCSNNPASGRIYRYRSAPNVVAEMELLVNKYRTRAIYIREDIFTLNKKRVLEICWLMKERGIDLTWACESRADTADEEMLRAMKDAGCGLIWFGVETGCQRILDSLNKGISVPQVERTFRACKALGIKAGASFMLGIPGETIQEMHQTIDFACALKPSFAWFNIFLGIPESPLSRYARENGCIDEEFGNGVFTIKTDQFDRSMVERIRNLANARFEGHWPTLAFRAWQTIYRCNPKIGGVISTVGRHIGRR